MKPNADNETVSETDDHESSHRNDGSQPDADHAIEFLQRMHGIKPDGKIYIYRARKITNPNHPDCGKAVTELAVFTTPDRIKGLWWKDSAHLFAQTFAVGTIRDDDKHNQAENIVSYPAVWCDIDACKNLGIPGSEFFADLRDADPMNPTCRVRSSEDGIQMYWLLDKPLKANGDTSVFDKKLKRLLCDMAYHYGGDFKVVLPSALMRLPGSVNVKKEYPTPYPVRAYWDREADQRKYTLAQIQEKFDGVNPQTVPRVISYAIIRAMVDIYKVGSRNELAMHLAGTVRDAGMDLAGCRGLLKEIRRGIGDDSDRAGEVEGTYKHEHPKTLAQDYPKVHEQIKKAVELWVGMKEDYSKKIGVLWSGTKKDTTSEHGDYKAGCHGLMRRGDSEEGGYEQIATFSAMIENEITETDGADTNKVYDVTVVVEGQKYRCLVPADKFDDLKWLAQTTSKAYVLPKKIFKDYTNVAIRYLSNPQQRTIHKHLGWIEDKQEWVYLHGGGVIGKHQDDRSPGEDIEVNLSGTALGLFTLPQPPQGEDLVTAIRAALRILDIGPDAVMFPILASVARSVLGKSNFTLFLVGPSGTFKSQIAALGQQFFGAGMNSANLPCSWSATANHLEAIAFQAKDALLVIDDFAPTGSRYNVQELHGKAERMLRAQGNNSSRGRANREGNALAGKSPRGLVLSTGEDTPNGFSALSRAYIVQVAPNDVKPAGLTKCQRDAAAGLYAQALSGFLAWLAPQYGKIKDNLQTEVEELRDQSHVEGGHRRTTEAAANLRIGLRHFLAYALDVGAVTEAEAKHMSDRGRKAIDSVAESQAAHQQGSEPVARFLELLAAAVAGGKAHIANKDGDVPAGVIQYGWRAISTNPDDPRYIPQGDLIGWEDGESLYLSMEAAYRAAQIMARESEGLTISPKMMATRIKERGLLLSTEAKRTTPLVRRRLGGAQQSVLHVAKKHVVDEGTEDEAQATNAQNQ